MSDYTYLIGKRVNVAGEIGTVTAIDENGFVCRIAYDRWPLTGGKTLCRVIAELPELVARSSFDYRPGDLTLA